MSVQVCGGFYLVRCANQRKCTRQESHTVFERQGIVLTTRLCIIIKRQKRRESFGLLLCSCTSCYLPLYLYNCTRTSLSTQCAPILTKVSHYIYYNYYHDLKLMTTDQTRVNTCCLCIMADYENETENIAE